MEARSKKKFLAKDGKASPHKGKDSISTKTGKKPFNKPFKKNTERTNKPFKNAERTNKPFKNVERTNKPFKNAERTNKPFKNAERKPKPFKNTDRTRKSFKSTERTHSFKKEEKSTHKFTKNDTMKRKRAQTTDPEETEGPDDKKIKSEPEEVPVTRNQRWKDIKRNRQQAERKDMFDIIWQSKRIWGQLRRKDCDEQLRKKSMKELHDLIRGKTKQMAFAHDSVRVLQCFIQFGSHEQRREMLDELKDDMVALCKSQYGRNVVKKLLMYGDKELVASVMQAFKGHVKVLLRHAAASSIVEYAYNDKAVLSQRLMLTEELYGNTFTVCKSSVCVTINKVIEANPDKVNTIIDEMKQILTPMAQKEQVIKHTLVHKVFLDFFQFAPEKQRTEMIESIREAVVYMVHTHDGARVAMNCVWHGTAKDRKVIIKTMKTYMVKIATGEFSHLILLAIFDCVDDTKLVKQAVLSELLSCLGEVLGNKYGKKVMTYLLSPRDPAHLLPETIQLLQRGDDNQHSKKEVSVRRQELLEAVSPGLLQHLCENAHKMATNKSSCVTVSDILASACGDLTPAMTAVAQLANRELQPGGGPKEELHLAEHPAGHLLLKWLLEQDLTLAEAGKPERFGRILVDTVGADKLRTWAEVNRGALVLNCLLSSSDPALVEEVKTALKPLIPELKQSSQSNQGAQILLQKLQAGEV